jgi:ASC-1-like (ASCH) protein
MNREWDWWVKSFILLSIEQGRKDLETRPNRGEAAGVQVGDIICFNKSVRRRVIAIRRYQSYKAMLAVEKSERFYPDATRDVILGALRGMYRTDPEQGVFCFELERIS